MLKNAICSSCLWSIHRTVINQGFSWYHLEWNCCHARWNSDFFLEPLDALLILLTLQCTRLSQTFSLSSLACNSVDFYFWPLVRLLKPQPGSRLLFSRTKIHGMCCPSTNEHRKKRKVASLWPFDPVWVNIWLVVMGTLFWCPRGSGGVTCWRCLILRQNLQISLGGYCRQPCAQNVCLTWPCSTSSDIFNQQPSHLRDTSCSAGC